MKERVAQKLENSPRLLTDRSTHDIIVGVLRRDYAAGGSGRKLLDAPAGAGALSVRMRQLGFDVSCADIDPGNFEAEGFEHVQADFNQPLPIPDEAYDVVVSAAGLQRVCFPEVTISEFYRILKPGGRLYLSVPNFATMSKRMRFLLYGTIGHRFDQPNFVQTLDSPASRFRCPLMYPRVEHMVRQAGFEMRRLDHDRRFRMHYALLPVSLLACGMAWLRSSTNRAKYVGYRRSSSLAMLGAIAYVITADKPGR
jgi:ubiquinone/menaquinone biosynthesis C-methylase UbiE